MTQLPSATHIVDDSSDQDYAESDGIALCRRGSV